ncbi:MAG: hypothetical protein ABW217_08770 [Polyangiaceae bacterium]
MPIRDVDQLLSLTPDDIVRWMEAESHDAKQLTRDDWRTLGSRAAQLARAAAQQRSEHAAELWTRLAVYAYEQVGSDSARFHAMSARANLIGMLGPASDGSVRDPQIIYAWLRESWDGISISVAVAHAAYTKPGQRQGLPVADFLRLVRPLRTIKNRLAVASPLVAKLGDACPEDVRAWLGQRADLP